MIRFKLKKSFDSILALIALTGVFVFAINFDLMWGKVQQDRSYVKDIVNKETSTIQSNLLGYSPTKENCFMFDGDGNQYSQDVADKKVEDEKNDLKNRIKNDFTDTNDPVAKKLIKDGVVLDDTEVKIKDADKTKATYITVTISYKVSLKSVDKNSSNSKSFTIGTSSLNVPCKEQCIRQIENPRRYRN